MMENCRKKRIWKKNTFKKINEKQNSPVALAELKSELDVCVSLDKHMQPKLSRIPLSLTSIYYHLAIDRAMEYAQAKLENYPLPDAKGKLSSFIFDVNYAFTK